MNEMNGMKTPQARAQATGTPPSVTRGTAQSHLLVVGQREADGVLLSRWPSFLNDLRRRRRR